MADISQDRIKTIIPPAPEKTPNADPELCETHYACGKGFSLDIRCPRCHQAPNSEELIVLLSYAMANLQVRIAELEALARNAKR